MTSWLSRNQVRRPTTRLEFDVTFKTDMGGFCSQFNRYFYHVYYAKKIGKELQVFDGPNCLSDTMPLLRTTFQDISGIRFLEVPAEEESGRTSAKLFDALAKTPRETLRVSARDLLQWNPQVQIQIQEVLKSTGLPTAFDLGIHIRTGQDRPIALDRYLRAIDDYLFNSKLKSLKIFVMSDNSAVLAQLKARLKGPFQVYSIERTATGHVQAQFNAKPFDEKFNEYMKFLTELTIMQKIPVIHCTLSSNVGKFIWLTGNYRSLRSMDISDFVPI
jgi:hypothetical protein